MDDIITIGSAAQDVFIKTTKFIILENEVFGDDEKGICLPLGSKIPIDELVFASGGAGTNTAVTFARLGLKVSFLGKIGRDSIGEEIKKELKKEKVGIKLIREDEIKPTAFSVILSTYGKGRTILMFRGASANIQEKEIDFCNLKARWFYIASLAGNFGLLKKIVQHAFRNNIKIAFNPGSEELALPYSKLKEIIDKVEILILNKEEAAVLTGVPYNKEQEIIQKTKKITPNIGVITKDIEGVAVFDKDYIYRAGTFREKVIEATGAGDAFGSGFVFGVLKGMGIDFAIRAGSFNATSVIKQIGAKKGIVKNFSEKELSKLTIAKERINKILKD